jgi:hypothetical protein
MKALIKSGLCLALGWLASGAGAQEVSIKWQASAAKNSSPIAVVSPADNAPTKSDVGVRSVTLSQPVPLDSLGTQAFRPTADPFAPIVRAQAADDKNPQPIPKLEVIQVEPKAPQKMPKDSGFIAPAPKAVPSPIMDSLGIMPDDGCSSGCGPSLCRPSHFNFGGMDCCPERPRFWATAEYLMWWQRAQNVPPLVTSSNPPNAPVLGSPNTTILYDNIPNGASSGGRFGLGMWFCHFDNRLGFEVSYFVLARQNTSVTFAGDGSTFLGRPFYDVTPPLTGTPSVERFSSTDRVGGATVNTYSQLWGFEGNLRYKWCCGPNYWLDIVGGYRNVNLNEGIDISERLQLNAAPNFSTLELESFHTRNQFNGAQFGLDGEWRLWNRFFFGLTGKVAMGDVYQVVNINGSTTFSANGVAPITQPGALLVTPTNMGQFSAHRFGIMPEATLKIGVDLTPNLRLFVGYNFLYLNSVVRPGDQIDLNVNQAYRPTPVGPGFGVISGSVPAAPQVLFRTTDYWAQGVNFGLQYRY